MKKWFLKSRATRTVAVLAAALLTLVFTVVLDSFTGSTATKGVIIAGGLLSGITSLGGGLVKGLTGTVGGLVQGTVGNIAAAAGNLATPLLSGAAQVLNTAGGQIAAGSLSGLTGGSSVSIQGKGLLSGVTGGSPTSEKIDVPWYKKFFNFYKLSQPEVLVDQYGTPTLNYDLSSGKRQLNWMKIVIFGTVILILIWVVVKMTSSKKSGGSRRMSRKSRGGARRY